LIHDKKKRFLSEEPTTHQKFRTPGDVVRWMRQQSEMNALVKNCYWDEDQETALRRFKQSDEFNELLRIFRSHRVLPGSRVLDLGAGNGIVSHAFQTAGFDTVALEPDSCPIVGWHSSLKLDAISGYRVPNVSAYAEALPFLPNAFDVVYCRQVLHHIPDLMAAATEIRRVLRPGGLLMATREHVISDAIELDTFLSQHPMHQQVGGENAYRLDQYLDPISSAGFKSIRWLGPKESPINFFPISTSEWQEWCAQSLSIRFGQATARRLAKFETVRRKFGRWHAKRDRAPGRLYTFIAIA
jgi:ubiquinone/menaquinone biosynthesis C-methylase UbiE